MLSTDAVVIVSIARTPIGNLLGCLKDFSATALGAEVIAAAVSRANIPTIDIDELLMGCVLPAGLGQAPARQAALAAGLPVHTPCTTLNKVCGSGMKAVLVAHDMLLVGSATKIVAGGMESMSNAPYLLLKARQGYRLGHHQIFDHMMLDGLEDAYEDKRPMGFFAEQCASQYQFSRLQQDEFAMRSIERAKMATEQGYFSQEIIPLTLKTKQGEQVIDKDERPFSVNPAKMPQLSPVFAKEGTITAGNASSIADGAAALVLMRLSTAEKCGATPLARIVGHTSHAQLPAEFTIAPIGAIKKLLQKIQWKINDVDLFEINEAFAVVTLVAMQELSIPADKININGGACALGHPIGASGARVIVTLMNALQQRGLKRGIAALCIGGGEATAIAIEML